MRHSVQSRLFLFAILAVAFFAFPAFADDVTISGNVTFASLDGSVLDHDHVVNGVFTVNDGNLTVLGTINCNDTGAGANSACAMNFAVSGNVLLARGSALFAENRTKEGNGGDITLTVGGNLTFQGTNGALPGAIVSSAKTNNGGTSHGGNITMTVGGTVGSELGSIISSAGADSAAGAISITSSGATSIGGLVLAGPSRELDDPYNGAVMTGGGHTVGGNILIKAQTSVEPGLVINALGVVASQTGDAPAGSGGSVTLEGCNVRINGLVASLGKKNGFQRVTVRSGTSITVDGSQLNGGGFAHLGRVRADSTQEDASTSRVELFAKDSINVIGPASGMYAVTVNPGDKDVAGTINVISTNGSTSASGNAYAATGTHGEQGGGTIGISAKFAVTLNGASINAAGGTSGGHRAGGHINVRSYSGAVSWTGGVGDVRPVGSTAGVPAVQQGTIALTYCTTLTTSGTSFPTNGSPVGVFPTTTQTCSPAAPSLPVGNTLPTCNTAPVANNDAYTVAEGGTLNVAAPGVLGNDTDAENNPITAILVSGPAHATSFALNADGSFMYVHNGGESTSDSFTYKANDGSLDSNVATVNITITPVNDAPVAVNDNVTVAEGGTINMVAPGVLANDNDPDSPSLTAILVSGPAHASSFALNPNGSYIYVHDGSETTSDSFTYKASDGSLFSNVATVNITITPVNDAPVANNDNYTVAEGGTLSPAAPGVLGNDTDADSPTLTANLVSGPAHATSFSLNADGSFNYVHDGSETTSDSFTYRANDGSLNSNVATVNITITPVNDAPVAVNDGPYTVAEGGTLNIVTPGVLGNDVDPDSPTLTAVLVTGPAHASSFTLNPDGSFNYVHDGSETLTDSFTYRANDGSLNSNIATVSITITPVNDAPVAVNDGPYNVAEGGTLNVAMPGVLGNDTDSDSPVLTTLLVSGPLHAASFTLNPDGSFNYVHDGGESTSDSFTYRANDGSLNSNVASVNITITPVNDAPVAVNDSYSVNEGGTLAPAAPGVLGNDTDVDSPTLTAVLVTGPLHAVSFALNADGSFTYVHDGSETTSDSFTYKASDGSAFSNVATVNINITLVNDAPVVTAGGTLTFTEGDAATVIDNTITISDSDSANLVGATVTISGNYANGQDVLSFVNTANITGSFNVITGTLTLTGSDTVANYEAALRTVMYFNASENPSTLPRTITWVVDDGSGINNLSAPVTSTINVVSTNSAPQLANGSTITYTENDPATFINSVITVSDTDSPNLTGATVQITTGYNSAQDVLSFTPFGGISGSFNSGTGTLTLSGTSSVANYQTALRNVKYTNTSDDPTTASRTVVFQVTDGTDASSTVSSTINVTAVNDPPTATAFSGLPAQAGIPITYPAGKLGGTDVEAGTTVTVDTTPINLVNGSVTLNANGSFTFTPTPQSAGGTASFQYRVTDNGNPAPGVNSGYVTVSFNVAGPAIYFVKASGTGNCTLGNECTLTTALAFGAANANIFISDAATHTSGPITLNTGASIIGQGIVAPSFDSIYGIVAPAQGTLAPRPAVNQARPTISNSPITLGTNSTVAGFNMNNNSGDTLIASSKSGLLVKDMDITSTAGSGTFAVHFTSSSGIFAFGAISVTGGAVGGGVNFTGTTSGSTATFATVSTTAGDAVTVAASGATNFAFGTVSSTAGKAVGLTTATGAFSFTKISANGATKAITVNGLTGAGSFTVNGTGGLCDSTHTGAGDCTGGTIQNITQRGAEFVNAANVTLKSMNFSNAATVNGVSAATCGDTLNGTNTNCNAAIHFANATGASLDHVFVNGSAQIGINGNAVTGLTMSTVEVKNAGNETSEHGVQFVNLLGTVTVTGSNFHNNFSRQFTIQNSSGTMNASITGSTFNGNGSGVSTGSQGVLISGHGTADMTVNAQTSTFSNNFGNGYFSDSSDTAVLNITLTNNSVTANGAGIALGGSGSSNMTYDLNGNTLTTSLSSAISVGKSAAATMSGFVRNNIIGAAATPLSGCSTSGCNGIELNASGTSSIAATITGNTVTQFDSQGIRGNASSGSVAMQLKISGNTISNPSVIDGLNGIFVQSGAVSTDTTSVCADIVSNSILGVYGSTQIRVRNRFAGTTFRLPGYAGAGNDTTAVALFLTGQNGGATASATINADTFAGGAACTTP
ncbi:MAG: hypothetical protein QOI24_914 [Acidobacteriota bacterium]|jgi:VCBS repeat-containing protein|nr:hypothetical protein [Acidobacteriota bacterium]